MDRYHIGTIEIEWIISHRGEIKKINSSKLNFESIDTNLAFNFQLGSHVYFVVYNFKKFQRHVVSWGKTLNASCFSDPISLLIINQTHLLIDSVT
jgi:hypothetical protein